MTTPPVRPRSLAHGGLIEADVRARLFGLPLLRLRARIQMVPADTETLVVVAGRDVAQAPFEPLPPRGGLEDARRSLVAARRTLGELGR